MLDLYSTRIDAILSSEIRTICTANRDEFITPDFQISTVTTETVTNNYMRCEHTGTSGSNGESTGNYEIILYNASCKRSDGTANTHRPMANCRFVSDFNNSTQVQQGHSVGIWNTTTPVDGFSLKRVVYPEFFSTRCLFFSSDFSNFINSQLINVDIRK